MIRIENNLLLELKNIFNNCSDVQFRILNRKEGKVYLIFIDNMCDSKYINEFIIKPLINKDSNYNNIETVMQEVLNANLLGVISSIEESAKHVSLGDVVILFSFLDKALYCEARSSVKRAISYPDSETTSKGPKDSFNEDIYDNISLVRQRVQNINLKVENFEIGNKSHTKVALLYIQNVAPNELIDYVRKKLKAMDVDFVIDSNNIEEEFKCKGTFFDTIAYNEKPDTVSASLFEGRIAIFVNGTPFVTTMPSFFTDNFISSDFYYTNKYVANYSKIVLIWIFILSITLPGVYIALTTNHLNLVPIIFVFKLGRSRAGVPFPTIVEMLLMLAFFDIARLAGKLIPQRLGQSVSVVAALILGNAAINAGIASESTIVVMGIVTISTIANSRLFGASRFWSIVITMASAALGLPGFYSAVTILISHIAGLNSCGYPYLFPMGTYKTLKLKEDFFNRGNLNEISHNIFKKRGKK